jgi:hypothetical protein
VTTRLAQDRVRAEDRIAHEMSVWRKKFQAMEIAQARYSAISDSLTGMMAQLSANNRQ